MKVDPLYCAPPWISLVPPLLTGCTPRPDAGQRDRGGRDTRKREKWVCEGDTALLFVGGGSDDQSLYHCNATVFTVPLLYRLPFETPEIFIDFWENELFHTKFIRPNSPDKCSPCSREGEDQYHGPRALVLASSDATGWARSPRTVSQFTRSRPMYSYKFSFSLLKASPCILGVFSGRLHPVCVGQVEFALPTPELCTGSLLLSCDLHCITLSEIGWEQLFACWLVCSCKA